MSDTAPRPETAENQIKQSCELLLHSTAGILGTVEGADALAISDGKVLSAGLGSTLRAQYRAIEEVDGKGLLGLPGFVDGHTHPAFAVGRAQEFDWRAEGLEYLEIAARGGGIHSSVRAVREASEEQLTAQVAAHFRRMQRHGTTACEAKSGYGLSLEDESKSLRAIHAAADATGMRVRATCLAAHMVPQEFQEDPSYYLEILCNEILPSICQQGLAEAVDVFIERGAFDLEAGRRYLEAAQELGLGLRVHADQFHSFGAVELAVELSAESVDHLEVLSDSGLEALALSRKTHAGLLPAVPHFLRQQANAPARRLLAAGVPYFIATDFNPGSCYTPSLPEVAHFARIRLNLSAAEALHGVTHGAATSLGWGEQKGRLDPGFDADFVLCELPDEAHFGYGFGENPVRRVFVGGKELS
ncbi:MAG: imidazolonepropionase [Planctomycetes bacterium]|nr:imidazolonepropionase [Planctomycetota bacterium]